MALGRRLLLLASGGILAGALFAGVTTRSIPAGYRVNAPVAPRVVPPAAEPSAEQAYADPMPQADTGWIERGFALIDRPAWPFGRDQWEGEPDGDPSREYAPYPPRADWSGDDDGDRRYQDSHGRGDRYAQAYGGRGYRGYGYGEQQSGERAYDTSGDIRENRDERYADGKYPDDTYADERYAAEDTPWSDEPRGRRRADASGDIPNASVGRGDAAAQAAARAGAAARDVMAAEKGA